MPSLSLGTGGPLGWFTRHGEKLGAALVGSFAALLAWWGIGAVMTESVKPERTPEKLSAKADAARRHIEAIAKPPAERVPTVPPLAGQLDAWRADKVTVAPSATAVLIDRPLFQELGKRTKPDVFPIEDLRAVAGVAVLPVVPAAGGMEPMPIPRQPEPPPEEPRRPGRPPARREREAAERAGEASPFGTPEGLVAEAGMGSGDLPAVTPAPPGKITPFVVVTGLIPAAKQREEFARRFATTSLRDPQRDAPKWGDYRVERALVTAGAAPQWKEMKNVAAQLDNVRGGMVPGMETGPALQGETLPPGFFLQPEEAEKSYVSPLPERIDEPWGPLVMHPWFGPRLDAVLAANGGLTGPAVKIQTLEQALASAGTIVGSDLEVTNVVLEGEAESQPGTGLSVFRVRSTDGKAVSDAARIGQAEGLVFALSDAWWGRLALNWDGAKPQPCSLQVHVVRVGKTPVARILEIRKLDEQGAVAERLGDPDPRGVDAAGLGVGESGVPIGLRPDGMAGGGLLEEFRLFRFVDTDVKPGETYRYRVRFALRNPNVGLLPRHLADPKDAGGGFLVSSYSNESPAVTVPGSTTFLVRTVTRDAFRKLKLKTDVAEVLVLAPAESGNFGLRSAVTGTGGLVNIDPALNRPGESRFFGEPVTTDRIVLDRRGRQEDRIDLKQQLPPEPLDLLLVRDDGGFELVSSADSQRQFERYRGTLFPPGQDLPDDGRKREPERRNR